MKAVQQDAITLLDTLHSQLHMSVEGVHGCCNVMSQEVPVKLSFYIKFGWRDLTTVKQFGCTSY